MFAILATPESIAQGRISPPEDEVHSGGVAVTRVPNLNR